MTDFPRHAQMQEFIADLNNFYLSNKQLWEIDNSWDGYEWIEANESEWNIISFKRKATDKSELIVVVNFSPVTRENYTVKVSSFGEYEEIFNTDHYKYGGKGVVNQKSVQTSVYTDGFGKKQNYFNINLPQNGAVILRKVGKKARRV
jgi:1,4-alpha-glucan branching enzyme